MDMETVREFVGDIGNEADRLTRIAQDLRDPDLVFGDIACSFFSLAHDQIIPDGKGDVNPTPSRALVRLFGL